LLLPYIDSIILAKSSEDIVESTKDSFRTSDLAY